VVDKLLAYIVGIFLVVVAGWILAVATGWSLPYEGAVQTLYWLREHTWESLLLAVVILLIGILPFLRPTKKLNERSFRTSSKFGEIRVTMDALSDIIMRSANEVAGVRMVQPSVREREDGLEVIVHCQLNPEVVIPEISDQLQSKVREDVERYTGIKVAEVKVLVRRSDSSQSASPARFR
jgi:uncharacterized alkaline shock family protein YloU